MTKLNVAVIFGGDSNEHEVSMKSAYNIMCTLDVEKYNIIPVYISKRGGWYIYDGKISNMLNVNLEKVSYKGIISPDSTDRGLIKFLDGSYKVMTIDIAIPIIHGKNGEDGSIQGLLSISKIPYIGCGVLASSMAFDKSITKIIVENLNIRQTKSELIINLEDMEKKIEKIEQTLKYPMFVKPSNSGSSQGISKVMNKEELETGIKTANEIDNKVIIEEGIIGRELECAILGDKNEKIVSSIGEIIVEGEFYGYEEKYNDVNSKTIIPDDIEIEAVEYIKESSKKIFDALGCVGLSRVDFFLEEKTKKVYFNEINTMPGFTNISMYPMLLEDSGVKYNILLDKLIEIGMDNDK